MTTLIEKMAQAAYLADHEGQTWWETTTHRKERYRRQVRAALAVVLNHYSDAANVSDAMYKAAYGIEYMAGTETRAIFAKQFAAAMKAAADE